MEQAIKQERETEQQRTGGNDAGEPSARQKAYIQALAKAAGLTVDVSTIGDRQKATRIIDSLKLLNRQTHGDGFDVRDRRIAFGMATKLVFVTHASREKDISKWSRSKFWDEVHNFYADYMRQQELAVVGNSME